MMKYLYNGNKLPAYPEDWEETEYPHAYVSVDSDGLANFYVAKEEGYVETRTETTGDLTITTTLLTRGYDLLDETTYDKKLTYIKYVAATTEALAQLLQEYYPGINTETWLNAEGMGGKVDGNIAPFNIVSWTNTDTYWKDGSLFLAASDPVPVEDTGGDEGGDSEDEEIVIVPVTGGPIQVRASVKRVSWPIWKQGFCIGIVEEQYPKKAKE